MDIARGVNPIRLLAVVRELARLAEHLGRIRNARALAAIVARIPYELEELVGMFFEFALRPIAESLGHETTPTERRMAGCASCAGKVG
jgi:hypothetical protein